MRRVVLYRHLVRDHNADHLFKQRLKCAGISLNCTSQLDNEEYMYSLPFVEKGCLETHSNFSIKTEFGQ